MHVKKRSKTFVETDETRKPTQKIRLQFSK